VEFTSGRAITDHLCNSLQKALFQTCFFSVCLHCESNNRKTYRTQCVFKLVLFLIVTGACIPEKCLF